MAKNSSQPTRSAFSFAAVLLACLLGIGAAKALVGPAAPDPADLNRVVMVLSSEHGRAGFCTAVVLAPSVLLTAAHCVAAGADLRVHFRDEAGGPVLLNVAETLRNSGYRVDAEKRRQRSVDLAMIRLTTPLPARFEESPVETESHLRLGERLKIVGFGVAREGDGRTAGILRAGVLSVRAPLSNLLLWAEDPNGRGLGACFGDSGAPIFDLKGGRVVAIADWATGSGARGCGTLTQAALVAPQSAWIQRTLALWGEGKPIPDSNRHLLEQSPH